MYFRIFSVGKKWTHAHTHTHAGGIYRERTENGGDLERELLTRILNIDKNSGYPMYGPKCHGY